MLFKALWGPPGLCIATVIISDTIIIESPVTSQCQIEVWKLCEVMPGHRRLQKHFSASKSQIQRKMVEISIGSPPFKNSIFEILDEKSFDHCNFFFRHHCDLCAIKTHCYDPPLGAPPNTMFVRATRRSYFIDANVVFVISHFSLPKAFFEGLKTMFFKAL